MDIYDSRSAYAAGEDLDDNFALFRIVPRPDSPNKRSEGLLPLLGGIFLGMVNGSHDEAMADGADDLLLLALI